jgi:hypothetical protein
MTLKQKLLENSNNSFTKFHEKDIEQCIKKIETLCIEASHNGYYQIEYRLTKEERLLIPHLINHFQNEQLNVNFEYGNFTIHLNWREDFIYEYPQEKFNINIPKFKESPKEDKK